MEDENSQGSEDRFGLRKATVVYLAGALAFGLVMTLSSLPFFVVGMKLLIMLVGYITVGIVLSRIVLRRLISFHPVHDTIHNNFSIRKNAVLGWPIFYPAMLFRMTINRVL